MANSNIENDNVNSKFFSPLHESYLNSEHQYHCKTISDMDFACLGILRCITTSKTGHEFLQIHGLETDEHYDPSHFFKALKSERRLANLKSLNQQLSQVAHQHLPDVFAYCPELDGFDIYAGDGHYIQAASFDEKKRGTKRAVGHFYRLNLRNHYLDYIALEKPDLGKVKKHDAKILQEASAELLRNGAPKGHKVIYAWDKAGIDYDHWTKRKNNSGIYFISVEKKNSVAAQISDNLFDAQDPRNEGIIQDVYIEAGGHQMRRIVYQDPRDGKIYTYITNELTLPAFALVLIYKHRWDIEKVFYQLKSKFIERKSWASSMTAKEAQATFECLAHNLCLLIENQIISKENMQDRVEEKKRKERASSLSNRDGEVLKEASNHINDAIQRATHRTQRFIRWLRNQVYKHLPWRESLDLLAICWGEKTT